MRQRCGVNSWVCALGVSSILGSWSRASLLPCSPSPCLWAGAAGGYHQIGCLWCHYKVSEGREKKKHPGVNTGELFLFSRNQRDAITSCWKASVELASELGGCCRASGSGVAGCLQSGS